MMKEGINKYIKNLTNLRDTLDHKKFLEIGDVLCSYVEKKNNFLYFAGIGKNSDLLQQISKTYNSIGIKTINLNITDCKHGDFGLVHEDSLIFCSSKSGDTGELIEFLEILKRTKQVKIVLFHSNEQALAKRFCDIDLYVPCVEEADCFNIIPSCSLVNIGVLLSLTGFHVTKDLLTLEQLNRNHPLGKIGTLSNERA